MAYYNHYQAVRDRSNLPTDQLQTMRSPRLSRLHFSRLGLFFLALPMLALPPAAAENLHQLRGNTAITQVLPPPTLPYEKNSVRRARSYPEPPPLIPHSIEGHEINLRANHCLSCHSRLQSVEIDAPMVGISHFINRELPTPSDVSPRHYFCTQCHSAQISAPPQE